MKKKKSHKKQFWKSEQSACCFYRTVRCLWSTGFVLAVRNWSWAAHRAVGLQVENLKQRATREAKSSAAQPFTLLHLPRPPLCQVRALQWNPHTQVSLISHRSTECPIKLAPTAKSHSATKPARAQSMAPTPSGDKKTYGHEKPSNEELQTRTQRNFNQRQWFYRIL